MKIGVVSDTHRNVELFDKVASWMVGHERIAALYHLGDDSIDATHAQDMGIEILGVPGLYEQGYRDGSLPCRVTDTILGLRILLVHSTEKDLRREDTDVHDIILSGHTHKPEIELHDGRLHFNPGHLKSARDKNIEPSFGILDINDHNVIVTLYDTTYKAFKSMTLVRSTSGLYKV
jgi:putative phosphoesterase